MKQIVGSVRQAGRQVASTDDYSINWRYYTKSLKRQFPFISTTGFAVTEEQLQEAATEPGVLQFPDDFLTEEFRAECERLIPDNDTIKPDEWTNAYLYLKEKCTLSM
jgi:hypothetical protein